MASGQVGGDPVVVEQGFCRMVVNAAPPRTFEDVEVQGESEVLRGGRSDMKNFVPGRGFRSLACLCLLSVPVAQATSTFESEPNNTPAQANAIAGATIVLGTMNEGDQDGFMWTVSDVDAQKRWVFELHGIPGRLTIADILRIEFAENGTEVARTARLTKMGTRDGAQPSITKDLLFEPGEYLIGIAYTGGSPPRAQGGGAPFRPPAGSLSFGEDGIPDVAAEGKVAAEPETGAYRFVIRDGSKLHLQPEPKGKGTTREQANTLRPAAEFATFETREASWYAFAFKPEDSGQRWDIRAQVPVGRVVDAILLDANGTELDRKRNGERGHISFPGLVPQGLPYYVQLKPQEPGFVTAIGSVATGQRVAGEEAEPNGTWQLANRVDLSQPLSGRANEVRDTDYFRFTVDEAMGEQLLALRFESEPDQQHVLFCLYDGNDVRAQCRDTTTPIELPDLLLTPGDWGLSVGRSRAEFDYRISLSTQGPVEPGKETEPNDEIAFATSVPANHRIRGRASSEERDFYRFLVSEEPQLWRFQVIGEGIMELNYHDGSGRAAKRIRPQPGQTRLRFDDMYLLPGKHHIQVHARDGAEYVLLARPLGPPDPDGEREPNDDTSRMQRLAIGQARTGLLSDVTDNDYYRFFLANWDHIRLTLEPPPDGVVAPFLYWYGKALAQGMPTEPGQKMTIAGVFPPGDYHVHLGTREPSDAEYRLSLERLPRYSCAADCEPNGTQDIYLAAPLPPDLVLEGVAGDWRDSDAYLLPTLSAPSVLSIRSGQLEGRVFLGRDTREKDALRYDAEAGAYVTTVPDGGPYQVIVESQGKPYRLELEFEHGPQPLAEPRLAADLSLELTADVVSAYRAHGQRIRGQLAIANTGASALSGRLQATTSDYRWQVALGEPAFAVAANSRASVPVEVLVPPDAWADRPVRISVRAYDEAGAQAETWTELDVGHDAAPVDPMLHWPIPDALRGGFNAAWLPFGGEWAGEMPSGSRFDIARDGLVFEGTWMACCAQAYGWGDDYRPELTFDLPGGDLLPVAGMGLNNFGSPNANSNIRKGTLLLSEDGQNFSEALSFETLPVLTEQYFALPQPVAARYARLRIDETFNLRSGSSGVTLGEWKLILQPGHDLSGGQGFNLANPAYGGHLVWDWPPAFYSPVAILDSEKTSHPVRTKPGVEVEYVIGFHENRAAQIQRVEWGNVEEVRPAYAFERVVVALSRESNVGPWEAVGELKPGTKVGPTVLQFEKPLWARFVKFTGIRQGDSGMAAAPNVIRIWERPGDDDYRSVLSEWGHASREGYYEQQAGLPPEAEITASGHTSRASAASLDAGQVAAGQVTLAKHAHWYRLRMPADANTLLVTVTGDPTVRTIVQLEDSGGTPVPLKQKRSESSPSQHGFEAFAEPGSEVFLHVFEPPRNVVFTWDTSASVNAHLPTIYNSLSAFVSQVVPGQESANLVPFGRGPLLDSWLGEPYMLQTILNDYPRRESSSSGEHALQTSTQALAPLAGAKSIVTITDGAIVHNGPMWKEMREVQPRVFGVGVAGAEALHHDYFQDWASVNGGHFKQLNYHGEMEVAFDRAATMMRRPADYTLLVQTEYREAPGPGRLQVMSRADVEGAGGAGRAVMLILDASGSMLQRMEGKRRIVIAKEVLTKAVRELLPAGTPVALRVFGHTEPGSCTTELLMPLGPLNPEAAAATIAGVQAMNLAKTPIADSLAAVAKDLKGAQGAAVVLVTDGEETCEGDPAKVIDSLAASGIDVTLNIVGFAIDDAALAAQFAAWAELGGGRYLTAQDSSGLSAAIEEALQVAYSVYDASGELVGEGLVDGKTVELERGVYRVVVKSTPAQAFEDVQIQGEDEIVLALD